MSGAAQLRFDGAWDVPPTLYAPFSDARFAPNAYRTCVVPVARVKALMRWGHYTQSAGKPGHTVALYRGADLVGACIFAQPSARLVAGSVWRDGDEFNTWELSRLYIVDGTGRNAESWFLARALRTLPPRIRMVVAYSAPAFGHYGGCYQAANWLYLGLSTSLAPNSYHYKDQDGRFINKRKPWDWGKKRGLSEKEVVEAWELTRHDEPKKHLYVWPRDRAARRAILRPVKPYPKPDSRAAS